MSWKEKGARILYYAKYYSIFTISPDAYLCILLWYNWDSISFDELKETMRMYDGKFTKVSDKLMK